MLPPNVHLAEATLSVQAKRGKICCILACTSNLSVPPCSHDFKFEWMNFWTWRCSCPLSLVPWKYTTTRTVGDYSCGCVLFQTTNPCLTLCVTNMYCTSFGNHGGCSRGLKSRFLQQTLFELGELFTLLYFTKFVQSIKTQPGGSKLDYFYVMLFQISHGFFFLKIWFNRIWDTCLGVPISLCLRWFLKTLDKVLCLLNNI